ncbi:hypothetical protein KC867_03450, partial [Candidatus Saccharibacteria bacterium]|nr:hypothetical protein [Candidatus Saccharibacteria bacterium]
PSFLDEWLTKRSAGGPMGNAPGSSANISATTKNSPPVSNQTNGSLPSTEPLGGDRGLVQRPSAGAMGTAVESPVERSSLVNPSSGIIGDGGTSGVTGGDVSTSKLDTHPVKSADSTEIVKESEFRDFNHQDTIIIDDDGNMRHISESKDTSK